MELGIALRLAPESCLLHLYLGIIICALLSNLLIAAKLLIAETWKFEKISTITEWRQKCLCIIDE